jgi:hypothetical protein
MQVSFQARLEPLQSGMTWTAVRLPFDPAKQWPGGSGSTAKPRANLRVKGTIGSTQNEAAPFPICTSLLRARDGSHMLLVTQKMRKGAKIAAGEIAEIILEPVLDDLPATPPPELARLLKQDRDVRKWFMQLNYSTRKYIADMVREPKSKDARQRRAELWMERILTVMEGELELPPILRIAFRRQPLAHAGWEAMTPIQRRNHLMAIAVCQSPDARTKRADHAAAEAARVARRVKGADAHFETEEEFYE